jgi:ABC transporter fused permease/ATP-binding protein
MATNKSGPDDRRQEKRIDKNSAVRLLALAWPERKLLFTATFFLGIGSVMTLVYPQAMRSIVDEALSTKNESAVNRWAVIILAVSVLQAIAGSIRYFLFTFAGERVVMRLRQRLYTHVLEQEIAFFDFNKTGELMSRLSADCSVLQNAVSVNISMALRNIVSTVGGLVLLVYTSPRLAAIVLVVVPPVAAIAGVYAKRIGGFSRVSQDALADASNVAEETISGIRTVRFFAQERFEGSRYAKALAAALAAARSRIRQISLFTGIASAFGYAAIAAVLWSGGSMVVKGSMSVGDLTQFIMYLMVVAFSAGALGSLWGDFMSAMGAARRVFEILERKPAFSNVSGRKLDRLTGEVEFRDVRFKYPARADVEVLQNLNFSITPGHSVALVGPSGSGKTTVASLLVRLYDPSAGSVLIDQVPVTDLEPDWLRGQVGVVSQEPLLISASIEENIRYGRPDASHDDVVKAAQVANAHEFIAKFPESYKTLVGERGIQLSGGQKQRVAIARAVLKDPKILVLDEATSALDTESEGLVQEALNRLMKGRTTLVIAHRLATIRGANRILVMENGGIRESGTHEELVRQPGSLYLKLINKQYFVPANPAET